MNYTQIFGATVIAAAMMAALPGVAHHATATFYKDDVTVELDGKIQELVWANPHGILVIQDAAQDYWIGEMAAVVDLSRQGLSPATMPVGADIKVEALPSRDGSNRVHVQKIFVNGAQVYSTVD